MVRKALLLLFLVLLFYNWHEYSYRFDSIKSLASELLNVKKPVGTDKYSMVHFLGSALPGGIAYMALAFINICTTSGIIYIFFKYRAKKVKEAIAIIVLIMAGAGTFSGLAYGFGIDLLYRQMRNALDILSSPLLDAILLPVLQIIDNKQLGSN